VNDKQGENEVRIRTNISRRGRGRALAAAAALFAVTLAACGGGSTSGPETTQGPGTTAAGGGGGTETTVPAVGGTLRVVHPTAPTTLDPAAGNSGYDHIYLYPMFDTLVNWTEETLEATPGLAKSWEYTAPQTLVFTLNEGVTFHDGTPFNAEAVKKNLERAKTWEKSNIKGDLATIDTVEVVSEYVVQLNLNSPDSALPLILSDRAGMMVSPTAWEADPEGFGSKPVGTGPFIFREFRTGELVSMDRYEDYWGEKAYLDAIEFSIIIDRDTGINAVVSGEQDFTFNVPPNKLSRVQNQQNLVVDLSPGLFHYEFYVNLGRAPFDDVRVREAMAIAIDRDAFVAATQEGTGEPAWGPLPSSHWAYAKSLEPTFAYNPERAKQLLAEAGYPNGLTIEVVSWTDEPSVRRAEVLQAQFAAVGITMNVVTTEVPQATASFFNDKRYDAYLAAWTGRPDPALTYTLVFSKNGYFNTAGVETPGLEDAIKASRSVADQTERAKAFLEVERIVSENVLYIPIAFPPDFAVYSTKVGNYTPNLLAKPKLNYVTLTP
jgi:ABC-type transport system substrate-binding protein